MVKARRLICLGNIASTCERGTEINHPLRLAAPWELNRVLGAENGSDCVHAVLYGAAANASNAINSRFPPLCPSPAQPPLLSLRFSAILSADQTG